MRVVILGMTEVGVALANSLSDKGYLVSIIENDPEKLKSASRVADAQMFEGDAADIDILRDAKTHEAQALIASTEDDSTNLMGCLVAAMMKVPRIISIVNNPKNESLFYKHSINVLPLVSKTVAELELKLYRRSKESILANVGDYLIIKVEVGEKSRLIGREPKLDSPGNIGLVIRGSDTWLDGEIESLAKGDSLVITCALNDLDDVLKEVMGE